MVVWRPDDRRPVCLGHCVLSTGVTTVVSAGNTTHTCPWDPVGVREHMGVENYVTDGLVQESLIYDLGTILGVKCVVLRLRVRLLL